MMGTAFMLTDGTNVVSLNPEWDIQFDDNKIESSHRTRDGRMYRYRWGAFKRCGFTAEFINSADMTRVNSWWDANTPLVLYDTTSTVVLSGYLVNSSKPVDRYVKPYLDMFIATIEMESY